MRLGTIRRVSAVAGMALLGLCVSAVADLEAHAAPGANSNCRATKSCASTTSTTTTVPSTTTTVASTTTTVPSTTTTVPSTTTTVPSGTCSGVNVSPSTDLQAAFDSAPEGTTFCFSPGTYVLTQHVVPRNYDRLISVTRRAAVLTGQGVYNGGFGVARESPPPPRDVLIQGFVIERFMNPWDDFPRTPVHAGANWTILDNEIRFNKQAGVDVGTGMVLRGNSIHDNGRSGFVGAAVSNVLVEGNDIGWNNTERWDPYHEAGGGKILKAQNVTFRNNRVHDNYGPGLWTDWETIAITYENNTLERNYGPGILHEASADAVIRNNTFVGNGLVGSGRSLWWAADLFLNDSKNVEIYGNTITAGVHGISLTDIDRGSNAYGLLEIRNVNVHDNTITLPNGGTTGMVGERSTAYTSANNRFTNNTYKVKSLTAASFRWGAAGTEMTWSQWRNNGNDLTGTISTY